MSEPYNRYSDETGWPRWIPGERPLPDDLIDEERRLYEREGHGTWVVTDDLRAARAIGAFLTRASQGSPAT